MFPIQNDERSTWAFTAGGFPRPRPSKTGAHLTNNGPTTGEAENRALSTRDEGNVNKNYVLQGSEANEAVGTIDGPVAQDTNRCISYLPMLDSPFTVQVSRDLPSAGEHVQTLKPIFTYVIRPQTLWNAMNIFRSTIVDNTEYFIQQNVYIRITQDHPDILRIGHILEIKSFDPRQVYVRVYWMYRPQDPPLTKQKYHGQFELIATNHMNVVDASRIVQHANVAHWAESTDPVPSGCLFWRQHYNVLTKELSPLQPICVCQTPLNPDEQPLICPHCQLRMHTDCITRQAAERLTGETDNGPNQASTPATTSNPSQETNLDIRLLPPPNARNAGPDPYRLEITDLLALVSLKWQEEACCLRCSEVLFRLF